MLEHEISELERLTPILYRGTVRDVGDITVEASGFGKSLAVGDRVVISKHDKTLVGAEAVGADTDRSILMLHGTSEGIQPGAEVIRTSAPCIHPCNAWLGRVVNARGEAADDKGSLPQGDAPMKLRGDPPKAALRRRMGGRTETGVKAFNAFLPICRGQRVGLFAGSGVGKTTLMGMMASHLEADVVVVGLIGERGREVNEFIQDVLGTEGMKKAVVVVATSDEPPLTRRDAAYAAMTAAEYFRDQGLHVLCLLDSVTRFAAAQREIGLAADEPPSVRAYPPSVFSRMSRLLERAGPGAGRGGDITGIFTVLVEGSDHDEPISDTVRGILDGHVVLEREIAERGRFPAINILRSVSRALPRCHSDEENELLKIARRHMGLADDMAELTRIGAYQKGTDPETDRAIAANDMLEDFLAQKSEEFVNTSDTFAMLSQILESVDGSGQRRS